MAYLIYNNISKYQFDELKKALISIEHLVVPFMAKSNFFVNQDSSNDDFLGVDFCCENSSLMGNIGFSYNEDISMENQETFDFYILKAIDKNNTRYYLKKTLDKQYSLKEIVDDSLGLFEKCILVYNAIDVEMLMPV